MRVRINFTKKGYLSYLSHLDLIRLFQRAFNRINLPVKYSNGFNPHPKFSIGAPLSIGITSDNEYMDVEIFDYIDEKKTLEMLNGQLPDEILIKSIYYLNTEESVTSKIRYAEYRIELVLNNNKDKDELICRLNDWYNQGYIRLIRYKLKKKQKIKIEYNMKEFIYSFIIYDKPSAINIRVVIETGQYGNLRPLDLTNRIIEDLDIKNTIKIMNIHRVDLYYLDGQNLKSIKKAR